MNVDGDMIYKILFFILMSPVTINHDALDLTIQGPAPPPHWKAPLAPKHCQTCSLRSMYGWQAGDWHPTGMLSCYNVFKLSEMYVLTRMHSIPLVDRIPACTVLREEGCTCQGGYLPGRELVPAQVLPPPPWTDTHL